LLFPLLFLWIVNMNHFGEGVHNKVQEEADQTYSRKKGKVTMRANYKLGKSQSKLLGTSFKLLDCCTEESKKGKIIR